MSGETFYFYKTSTVVLNKLGAEAAAVHAVIWNSSQEGYQCELGEAEIGNLTHMSYKRVEKNIKLLLEFGYIENISPKAGYRTKAYKFIPSAIVDGIKEGEKVTLASNTNRMSEHRNNKEQYETSKEKENKMNDISDTNRHTNDEEKDDDISCHSTCDKSYHQMIQAIPSNDISCIPINNSNNYKEQINNYDFSFYKKLNFFQETISECIEIAKENNVFPAFLEYVKSDMIEEYQNSEDFEAVQKYYWKCEDFIEENKIYPLAERA